MHSRALPRPFFLLRVEDVLQAARVKVDEDEVRVHGLVASILTLERLSNSRVRRPIRNDGATEKEEKKTEKIYYTAFAG